MRSRALTSAWTVVLALAVAAPLAGQGAGELQVDRFRESVQDRVAVSGGVHMGLMAGDPAVAARPGRLSVRIPSGADGMLCVTVSSLDGRYEARLEKELNPELSGPRTLVFQSDHLDLLEGLEAAELAVLAALNPRGAPAPGRECDLPGSTFLVTTWEAAVPEAGRFFLLVNSGGPERLDTSVIVDTPEGPRASRCTGLPYRSRIAYDTICTVEWSGDVPPARVRIERRRLGSRFPPIDVQVRW